MTEELIGLWGEEFELPKVDTKAIIKKAKSPKEVKEQSIEKQLKSKKLSLEERLEKIKVEVLRVLGKQKDNTIVIKTKDQLVQYIDKAIENKVIAIDTETNNSTDPITCKLMGPCIYTPGLKQAYIPINHTDLQGNRLSWQLTEEDIKEQFSRLKNTFILMHNGKFDYQVIKCTCGLALHIDWDTMVAAHALDENESASLKWQYINKVDPEQEKYDIEHLFDAKNVEFAFVDPEIFALYSAADAMMTYKLYLYQLAQFKQVGMERLYQTFKDIENEIVIPVAEMELAGITIDQEYSKRLSDKYHKLLEDLDKEIEYELEHLKPQVDEWRLSPEANQKPTKKTGEGFGKSKAEQLDDPINLGSPTQLAILFYDVLKLAPVDNKKLRGTGEEELIKLAKQNRLRLCDLLVERRGLVKLLTSFIDSLPTKVNVDGKIHCHFNTIGTDTGRFSSSDPNLQQIPSSEKSIRLMFEASPNEFRTNELEDNRVILHLYDEIETPQGWIEVRTLKKGDSIQIQDEQNSSEWKSIESIHTIDSFLVEVELSTNSTNSPS